MNKLNFSNAIVLLYHGVTTERGSNVRNSSGKHIFVGDFNYQMRYIKKKCNIVSLRQLLMLLQSRNKLPERTVAVTFDDCFKNVFKNAYPILKEYHIPATLFIATGFVGNNRLIWADRLELILERVDDKEMFFQRLEFLGYHGHFSLRSIDDRREGLAKIKQYLKSVDEKAKDTFIARLSDDYGWMLHNPKSEDYKTLTWEDVCTMDNEALIEVGSHTVNHPILSRIPLEEAEKEIVSSKQKLQNELNHPVDLFSYPEGQEAHYNDAIIKILKDSGFICGLSAMYGDNLPGASPFHLKRIMVGFMGIPFPFENKFTQRLIK